MVSGLQTSARLQPGGTAANALTAIADDVARDGFAFRTAKEMRALLRTRGLDAWPAFAASWNELGLDIYMADGGRYRRRRFAAFGAADGVVTRKPHQPHYQSRDHNPLNGGIERWFMPVADGVAANGFTRGILGLCTTLFDATSAPAVRDAPFHVEMHQFRIEATPCGTGLPTPEGPHRDGVDWVCVMLVNRTNVSSGVTQIFGPDGRPLGEFTLTEPLDAVFLDDRRVFHGVTPIAPVDGARRACRDVLVLTYRREDRGGQERP
jgi:hypothetical protein